MITETGVGLADADSYVDPAGALATSYMAAHLYADAWTAATTGQREAAVMQATRLLDGVYSWNGDRTTTTQALGWPRSGFYVDGVRVNGLPRRIAEATLETALALLQRNRTSDTGSGEAEVQSITLGSGALKLDLGSDPTVAPTPSNRMVPPYVVRLLNEYGDMNGGGMTRIYRA